MHIMSYVSFTDGQQNGSFSTEFLTAVTGF